MKTTLYLSLIITFMSASLYTKQGLVAQNVGINSTGATAHPSALLDLDASASPSVGLLVPRISLSLTTLPAPVTGPANSLMVYNLATTTGTAGVSPGYYYWDATTLKWIRIQTSATTASDWNLLGNAGTAPGTNFLGTTDAQDLVFKTNGVEAVRTTSAGLVGIGTATPAQRFTLENGSMQLGESMPAVGVGRELRFSNQSNNSDDIWLRRENIGVDLSNLNLNIGDNFGTTGGDKFNVGAYGAGVYHPVLTVAVSDNRVGIGTTTPYNKLHVYDSINGTFTGLAIDNRKPYGAGTGTNQTSRIALSLSEPIVLDPLTRVMGFIAAGTENEITSVNGFLSFGTRTSATETEKMRITSAGNVGIGTSAPTQPLQMASGAFCSAAGVWTNASDSRLKENIKKSAYGLAEVMKLRPVTYTMKANGEKQIGFIAQEVKKIIPEVVSGKEGDVSKGETLGLSYGNMVALLTQAMQEQQMQMETQQKQNETQQTQLELLTKKANQVDELQQQINELKKLLKK